MYLSVACFVKNCLMRYIHYMIVERYPKKSISGTVAGCHESFGILGIESRHFIDWFGLVCSCKVSFSTFVIVITYEMLPDKCVDWKN